MNWIEDTENVFMSAPAEIDDSEEHWKQCTDHMNSFLDAAEHCALTGEMSTTSTPQEHSHREKSVLGYVGPACVARPVSRKEASDNPKAKAAQDKEWSRLIDRGVWSYNEIREWDDIARDARKKNETVHLGRIFGIMVEKGSELPEGDPNRKFKYRVVFQGNNVVTQNWEAALFQDLGSSPASMEASKAADAYGSFPGHDMEQADAEQAYVQAYLEGVDTWICLPDECIQLQSYRHLFFDKKGNRKHRKPCVRFIKALYGHPDAGSCWELHCDRRMKAFGFEPITDWPSCYFHKKLRLMLMVYVDDFKIAGPRANLKECWDLICKAVEMGRNEGPGLFLGCNHERFERTLSTGVQVRGLSYNME